MIYPRKFPPGGPQCRFQSPCNPRGSDVTVACRPVTSLCASPTVYVYMCICM